MIDCATKKNYVLEVSHIYAKGFLLNRQWPTFEPDTEAIQRRFPVPVPVLHHPRFTNIVSYPTK